MILTPMFKPLNQTPLDRNPFGLEITKYGTDKNCTANFDRKITQLFLYLQRVLPDEPVLVLDGSDVIIRKDPRPLLHRIFDDYRKYNTEKVYMGREWNLWPPKMNFIGLNSGMILGINKHILTNLQAIIQNYPKFSKICSTAKWDDQGHWAINFTSGCLPIPLSIYDKIILSVYFNGWLPKAQQPQDPYFVHWNGPSKGEKITIKGVGYSL